MRLQIKGLWTNPSDLDAPLGSTDVLLNMTEDRPGIWEPRRGFTLLEADPTLTGPVNAIISFRGSIIVHHSTASISRWTGTAWSAYSGTFTPPTSSISGRPRFAVMNESLFVTTTLGVYELDNPTTGTWRLTGSPQALDSVATLRRTVNETGFATADGQWAYRVEWGFKNANGRLQIGAPSGRFLVQNPANLEVAAANISKAGSAVVTVDNTIHGLVTGEYIDVTLGGAEANFAAGTFQVTVIDANTFTYNDGGASFTGNPGNPITYGFSNGRNVSLAIPIPSGITTDNFVLVFRSAKSASATLEPSDIMAQVFERSPTNLEITAGSMTVVDLTPDDFRGALLDISGETILAAKYRPPVCADFAQFHNSAFCAATKWLEILNLQLIAIGGTVGIVAGDFLEFADHPSDPENRTWFVQITADTTESVAAGLFKVFTTGTVAQNVANTAKSMVRAINGITGNSTIYARYISSDVEAPGKMEIRGRTPAVGEFTAYGTAGSAFLQSLPTGINIDDIARSGTTVTVNTLVNHGFTSGEIVSLVRSSDTADFPNGLKTVTVVDANTFTYTEAGNAVVAEPNTGFFVAQPLTDLTSIIIDRTDRLVFSLPDQPWAVPQPNELFIEGTPTLAANSAPTLFRIIPNRDRLYIWADSGLFQVTGFYPDFRPTTIQTPLKMLAPETGVSQGTPGKVYGLADTGALGVMTGPGMESFAIQNTFQALQANAATALRNYAFAVAYPSEFKVLFFLPESSSDTKATNAYVLHTDTGEWARWDVDATCGMVDPVTDKLYLGQADGAVWVERKARTLHDFWDPGDDEGAQYTYTSASGTTIVVTDSTGLAVGDVFRDDASGTGTIITAINGNTLTVPHVDDFSAPGTATQEHSPYTKTVRHTRWFGKEGAEVDKEIDTGLVFVEPPSSAAEFTTLTLAFRNDYDPTLSTAETLTLDSVTTSQLPFNVPTNMQRSGWIQGQISHSAGGQRFGLLAIGYNYRVAGPKGP